MNYDQWKTTNPADAELGDCPPMTRAERLELIDCLEEQLTWGSGILRLAVLTRRQAWAVLALLHESSCR